MLVEWNDNMSVGMNMVDDQHKILFKMINDFYDQLRIDSTNKAPLISLIGKMKNYTKTHFSVEEVLFVKHKYPSKDAHKAQHELFINKVIDLENKIEKGAPLMSSEITGYLKDWIVNHIMVMDKAYSSYFKKIGVI